MSKRQINRAVMETVIKKNAQTYRARPEPGQLVEVRRRQWVVADVNSSKLESGSESQNCVTLSLNRPGN